MPPRRLQLEVFDVPRGASGSIELSTAALETAKLEAYEKGYAAGWEDSTKSEKEAISAVRGELSVAFQEIGFTVQEATSGMLRAMEPLLHAITKSVVPAICHTTLREHIVTILLDEVTAASQLHFILRVHPELARIAEEAILHQPSLKVTVRQDESLAKGSVVLLKEAGETTLNTEELCARIHGAVSEFLDESKKDNADAQ